MNKFLIDSNIDDSSFIKYLNFDDLIKQYHEEKKNLFSSIDKTHDSMKDEKVQKKLRGIEQDLKHRMVLNSCIFPCLSDNGELLKLGYQFICASPLLEKHVPNFDFLLFHPEEPTITIFGEAKGDINDPGPVVDQTKERIKEVQKNLDYIKENYLKNSNSSFEYVLGVNWSVANETKKSILRKGGGLILWNSGIIPGVQQKEVISFVAPSAEDGAVGKTMFHKDDRLNKQFHEIETSYQCKDIFLESHRLAKLRLINYAGEGKIDGIFSYSELFELVKDELFYVGENIMKEETEEIIRFAKENLKYIEDVKGEIGKYKILAKRKKTNMRDEELKNRWIEFELEFEAFEEKQVKLKELQERLRSERDKRHTLDEHI